MRSKRFLAAWVVCSTVLATVVATAYLATNLLIAAGLAAAFLLITVSFAGAIVQSDYDFWWREKE